MHVRVYVGVYVYIPVCMHAWMYGGGYSRYLCYMHTHTYMPTQTQVYIYIYVDIYMHTQKRKETPVKTYIHVFGSARSCTVKPSVRYRGQPGSHLTQETLDTPAPTQA